MKAYTDLNQSKKLAEILKWRTADMTWVNIYDENHMLSDHRIELIPFRFYQGIGLPAWSLAALLNYLREIDFFPNIEADEHGVTMNICYYDEDEGELLNPVHDIITEAETFIDACYEMIIKLHEQKIL